MGLPKPSRLPAVAILATLGTLSAMAGAAEPEDCAVYYYGIGKPRDLARAFACELRTPDHQKDWAMLVVMYLNGEGTPINLAKARDAFRKLLDDRGRDASTEALEKVLVAREANPKRTFPRIDFCKEIAQTTLDGDECMAIEQRLARTAGKRSLQAVSANLDREGKQRFAELESAFNAFRKAEGSRMYEAYRDGTIRNAEAMEQENRVERDFQTALAVWGPGAKTPPPAKRAPAEADKELNDVYRAILSSYEAGDATAKEATRVAQRLWLKYAASWKRFAESSRPDHPMVDELRAYLIEQRIAELRADRDR